jgi:type I restriction enzyme S subunit
MTRLKYLATVNPPIPSALGPKAEDEVSFLPMELIGDDGTLNLSEIRMARDVSQGYTPMSDGDVIVAKITPCFENGKGALCSGLQNRVAFGTTELIVLRPKPQTDPRFLYWITRSYEFRNWGRADMKGSAGQKRVTDDFVRDYRVEEISLSAQRRIAVYLDEQTAKVDNLIALRRKQIDLLREQRAALIQQAVTRGLNPNAPTKDSGLKWIGDIPNHWKIYRTKRLFYLSTEKAPENNDYELLSLYTEIGVEPRKDLEARGNKASTTDGYWIVRKGDIIVNKLLAWMGAIGESKYDGVTSPAYDIFRKVKPLNTTYYHHLFRSGLYLPEIKRRSTGIMDVRLRVYYDQLGEIPLLFPPLEEQTEIVEFINKQTLHLEKLAITYERQIELLQEYRAALIHECVTGQREVP